MTLSTPEFAHVLLALGLLLVAAHAMGGLFARFRQPRVIGEIAGGLLLGPTLLRAIAPGVQATLFPVEGPTPIVLDALYQLGLLLLMFVAGTQMRARFATGERRVVIAIAAFGIVLPLIAGLVAVQLLDVSSWMGPNATRAAFVLVFAIAVAVTSIPVISRIMHDLGILQTSFARIVLTVAVIEDVVLYVLLAIALGLGGGASEQIGLPAVLDLRPNSVPGIAFHTGVTLAFLAVALIGGPWLYRRLSRAGFSNVERTSPLAFRLLVMLAATLACLVLGVVPLYGAFLAGIVVGRAEDQAAERSNQALASFSFAFFVPLYFAIIGLRLDLLHDLQPLPFLAFLAFACAAKAASVYLGASVAHEGRVGATNLAVALNARGGPGIVLASVTFSAGLIDSRFFATLVMVAIVTSLIAGSWLGRVVRRGEPLRDADVDRSSPPEAEAGSATPSI